MEFLDVVAGSAQGAFTDSSLVGTTLTTASAAYSTGSSTELAGLSSELTVSNVNSHTENTGITIGLVFKNTSGSINSWLRSTASQCTTYYTAGAVSILPLPLQSMNGTAQRNGGFIN
jgi:hypothetical protein